MFREEEDSLNSIATILQHGKMTHLTESFVAKAKSEAGAFTKAVEGSKRKRKAVFGQAPGAVTADGDEMLRGFAEKAEDEAHEREFKRYWGSHGSDSEHE